jgi:hypothetical protein
MLFSMSKLWKIHDFNDIINSKINRGDIVEMTMILHIYDGSKLLPLEVYNCDSTKSFITLPKSIEVSDTEFHPYYWMLCNVFFWTSYEIRFRIKNSLRKRVVKTLFMIPTKIYYSEFSIGEHECIFYVNPDVSLEDIEWKLLNPGVPLKIAPYSNILDLREFNNKYLITLQF